MRSRRIDEVLLTDELLLTETAAAAGTASERGRALLEALRRIVLFDGAWLALVDPLGHGYHLLASVDLDVATTRFLSGPRTAPDIEPPGTGPPPSLLSPAAQPHPAEEHRAWSECPPVPPGTHGALALGLSAPTGRHVGFFALLPGRQPSPSPVTRRRLERLAPVLAQSIDPIHSLDVIARLVRGATAGVVLKADGDCQALSGLPADELLAPHSPVLGAAQELISEGNLCSSFLWPVGGTRAPWGHLRVTALSAPEDVPQALVGVVMLSPASDLHGLTPRELEVVGLLVKGFSNQEIADTLFLAPRTVAAHLEHVLSKLEAPTRTLVAVRASRDGLYVPFDPPH